MSNDRMRLRDQVTATVTRSGGGAETLGVLGRFSAHVLTPRTYLLDAYWRIARQIHALQDILVKTKQQWQDLARLQMQMRDFATVKWDESVPNTVVRAGRQHILDNYLEGSSFTMVGPFLGLISSVGYAAGVVASDTMASHSGWNEAGNGVNYPTWGTPSSNGRAPMNNGFDAATAAEPSVKALTTAATFICATNGGTVKGAFIVLGTNAVATNNSTAGTLFSGATFGSDKTLADTETLNVSWELRA